MPWIGRKRSKRGDQVLGETSRRPQQPPSSGLPHSEDRPHQHETRSRVPPTCEDHQPSNKMEEEKHVQAPDRLSQETKPAQILQSREAQVQNKAYNVSAHSELPIPESTQVQQLLQSHPPGEIAAAELGLREQFKTETENLHSGPNFRSESSRDTRESIREPSPKKRGKRYIIKTALRQKAYATSQEETSFPDRGRLEKEPADRKGREGPARDPKKPPLPPPTSYPIQARTDSVQSTALKSDGGPEVLLARRNSSRHRPVMSQQEPSLSRLELERDEGSNNTVLSRSEEEVEAHAWERHLPQAADDATIKNEVLTLFEFIEHHVDDYYCDASVRISQAIAGQLSDVPAPCLPDGATLQSLLEQARYKTPIIKHCLISLMVSGMSFQEQPLFPLLPEEFTVLPRAVHKETFDMRKKLYYDQAFSKYRSICAFLRPTAQQDSEYKRKLDERISRAVALCSKAFAPWEDRDSALQNRHDHLIHLFYRAARVGVLIFSQPSTLVFDWTPPQKANLTSAIQVWPRLLRTTNHNAEPLPKSQVIVEGSSQHIDVEKNTSYLGSSDSKALQSPHNRDFTNVYDAYRMSQQDNHFGRPAQAHPFGLPSELPATQTFVSANFQGRTDPSNLAPPTNHSDQEDKGPGYPGARGPQTPAHQYSALNYSTPRDQHLGYHETHFQHNSTFSHSPPTSSAHGDQDLSYRHVHGPQQPQSTYPSPSRSAQRDHDREHRDFQGPQGTPYPCSSPKDLEQIDGDKERRGTQSSITSPQNRASNQDMHGVNMQSRQTLFARKPVANAHVECTELPAS